MSDDRKPWRGAPTVREMPVPKASPPARTEGSSSPAPPRSGRPAQPGPSHRPTEKFAAVRPSSHPSERAVSSPQLNVDDDDECPTHQELVMTATSLGDGLRDRAALIRLDGPCAGQPTPFPEEGVLRIGRGREAELRIDDDGVSRLHASVTREGGHYVLLDLGSRNGTTVQQDRVGRRQLADGDVIRVGPRTTFRFALLDARQEALFQQLYDSSVRDALTGAYNRQHFRDRLHVEIAYAARQHTEMSLLMLDLDHFKHVNDTHGHLAGDAVLKYVAALAMARLRTEDIFVRYGGEEFAVILRGINILGAGRAGERLRGTIGGRAVEYKGVLIPVTISIGCASLACTASASAEELLAIADRRLYLAKGAGRNRVVATDTPA